MGRKDRKKKITAIGLAALMILGTLGNTGVTARAEDTESEAAVEQNVETTESPETELGGGRGRICCVAEQRGRRACCGRSTSGRNDARETSAGRTKDRGNRAGGASTGRDRIRECGTGRSKIGKRKPGRGLC